MRIRFASTIQHPDGLRIERLLDDVGWRLLAALQENARRSWGDLGRPVGLSAPAAAERVRRLEDAGIIRGYRLDLGLEPLGLPIGALIRVSAPEEKCHHVTGSDSFALKVVASSSIPGPGGRLLSEHRRPGPDRPGSSCAR